MRLLLVCGLAVLATAELARKAHFLNTVLGSRHTAQLGLNINDLDDMVMEDEQMAVDADLQRAYLACSTLSASSDAATKIVEVVGEDNKQTVFSSRGRNTACWAIRATSAQANMLSEDGLMQSVVVMPREAKIHFNVLDFFEYEMRGVTPSGEGWKRTPTSADQSVLKIEFGLGTFKGMNGIDMAAAVASWRSHGAGNAKVTSSSLSRHGRWAQVHQLAGRESSLRCDYSGLNVQFSKFTAQIRGLSSLASSAHGMNCLSRFVELAASDHRVIRVLVAPEYKPFNIYARGITQTGIEGDEPFGLTGAGQVVGVADSGVDDLSCFFVDDSGTITPRSTTANPQVYPSRRKVIQYVAYADDQDEESGHGTHVCGSVLGNSNADNTDYNGMAQGAKLAFFDIGVTDSPYLDVPSLYDDVFPAAAMAGAHVHSNSWGSSYQACDESCLDIDTYTYENPDFVVLFAASNDGANGYFSIGNPAMSKNCVTVGAAQEARIQNPSFDNDDMAYFSSIGPTFDGRIKPDVAAPGSYIYSAKSSGTTTTQTCDTLKMRGTSMATPVTSGNAALIRQYFADDTFWAANCNATYASCGAFNATGTLVKAMLINSGEAMANYDDEGQTTILPSQSLGPPPDYFQGYGRVKLDNTLRMAGVTDFDLYVLDKYNVNSDDTIELELTIVDTSKPVRVTLSWYDPPTTGYTSKQVLHDLDLLVVAPDATTYWGNGKEFGDEYNNNEKVYIATPVAGTYKVYVHAYTLTEAASQAIALVITSGGSVTGPTAGAAWAYDQADRACGEMELAMNLIDLGLVPYTQTWGMGKFLSIVDDNNEIVYLGMSAKQVTPTSACLADGDYSAVLTLGEVYGTDDEIRASTQAVAEIKSCAYVMLKGVETYDFSIVDGACDYCHGQYQFDVSWTSVASNPQRSIWLTYSTDGAGNAIAVTYGGTGLDAAPVTICLDPGVHVLEVRKGQNSGTSAVTIPACGAVTLNTNGAYACVTVDEAGGCTMDATCEINFEVSDDDDFHEADDDTTGDDDYYYYDDDADDDDDDAHDDHHDDDKHDDDKHDDDDDETTIAGLSVGAFAGVMIGVAVAIAGLGFFMYRRQTPPEPTHVLMKD